MKLIYTPNPFIFYSENDTPWHCRKNSWFLAAWEGFSRSRISVVRRMASANHNHSSEPPISNSLCFFFCKTFDLNEVVRQKNFSRVYQLNAEAIRCSKVAPPKIHQNFQTPLAGWIQNAYRNQVREDQESMISTHRQSDFHSPVNSIRSTTVWDRTFENVCLTDSIQKKPDRC